MLLGQAIGAVLAARPDGCPLCRMDREILARVGEGWLFERIAKEQGMSVRMLKYRLFGLRWRFGVDTSCAVAVLAVRRGWI